MQNGNRYHMVRGSRFYRVRVKPLKPHLPYPACCDPRHKQGNISGHNTHRLILVAMTVGVEKSVRSFSEFLVSRWLSLSTDANKTRVCFELYLLRYLIKYLVLRGRQFVRRLLKFPTVKSSMVRGCFNKCQVCRVLSVYACVNTHINNTIIFYKLNTDTLYTHTYIWCVSVSVI